MHDAIKHTAGTATTFAGLLGSVTLANANEIVSLLCGITGLIAGLCTICSWLKKNK